MATNSYKESFRAYLSDTSAYGNVYYFSYHRWVAITKENFFINKVSGFSDLFHKHNMKLFVLQSSLSISNEAKLHEVITVILTCTLLKKLKAILSFIIYNSEGKQLAESLNTIIFVNSKNEIIPIPDNIRQALLSISNK